MLIHLMTQALGGLLPGATLSGWLGETYTKGQQPMGTADDPSGMRIISWDPRIFHYRRFLSEGEAPGFLPAAGT